MKDGVIRILGIAPYEGMKRIMLELASEYPEIELTALVGDLQNGVDIAKANFHGNYDMIISRGGTAKLLERQVGIPVIDIEMTPYDILRALNLAKGTSGKYAIAGFQNITSNAHLLCELLQYQLDTFTINNSEELDGVMSMIKARGYDAVLCDVVSNKTAMEYGLNAFLVTSGAESIRDAFERALFISRFTVMLKQENSFLRGIIGGQINQTVVFEDDGSLYFSSLCMDDDYDTIIQMLLRELPRVPQTGRRRFVRSVESVVYTVTCQRIRQSEKCLCAFYFSCERTPISMSRCGIKYSTREEAEQMIFKSFYSIAVPGDSIRKSLDQIGKSSAPVMLSGEYGTGKNVITAMLYIKGEFSSSPLITVDCSLLNEKAWNFLMDHHSSPLNDVNSTLHIQNIDVLNEEQHRELLASLINMEVCRRNKVIFSCVHSRGEGITDAGSQYVEKLGCVTVSLPTLREQSENIATFASLYISTLNLDMSHQISGIEPEGIKLLKSYEWPNNFTQFKRVISELATTASGPAITAAGVKEALGKERSSVRTQNLADERSRLLDLNRPLCDIEREVVALVLDECAQNQSAAASRLGISRTTLWRMLRGK